MIREQCSKNLAWFQQLTKIATELNVDLEETKHMTKKVWKKYVEQKTNEHLKVKLRKMIKNTRYYEEIQGEETITPGTPKTYMREERKIGIAISRARTNTLDPKPRKPEWNRPFQCKFCLTKDQSSRHYILECEYTRNIFEDTRDREKSWNLVKTLDGDRKEIEIIGKK